MKPLPDGWRQVTIGQVADTALGKMLDRQHQRGMPAVPYLRNVNVQWGRIDTTDISTMELSDDERERFAVEPGDLLACEGGEIGRAAIWHGSTEYIAFQKALHRIRSRGSINLTFLRYLLQLYSWNGTLRRFATGSTIAHLPQQQLRSLPVPLPPLAEQARIVDVLEDQISRLDGAKGYLDSLTPRLTSLPTATLLRDEAVSAAERRPLRSILADPLTNGRSVPTREGGFPVLRLTALGNGTIDLSQRKGGAWAEDEARPFLVQRGDFLVSRGNGSLHLVGRGGLVRDQPDGVAYPDTLIRVYFDESIVDRNYMSAVWNSPIVREQIERMARTTAGIYKVNQKHVESVELPLPSLNEQERVSARIEEAQGIAYRLQSAARVAESRAATLRQALLAAAFSGRLTRRSSETVLGEELPNA